jgi:trigger factor
LEQLHPNKGKPWCLIGAASVFREDVVTIHKELTRLEHSSVKLTLTIGKDDVRSQYDELLNDYGKSIQIPGFRKGKVPREVLIRKFGDALKAEVLGAIIEKSLGEVFEDENFARGDRPLPYSTPQIQDEAKFDLENDFVFSVVYDVLPSVQVGTWKGLEVEAPEAELTEEDINRELEVVRERNAIVIDREDAAGAERGNVVTIDYCELDDNGEVAPKSERQDFVFTLGSGYNIYKLDDDILGMKKGETKELVKTYPADEADSAIAGKTIKLRVTLTALKERKLPELDDDLAQDVDEKYETLEDLKDSIRESMSRNLEQRLRDIKINNLLEKIVAGTPVDVPESMIRVELEARWRSFARRFNMPVDQIKDSMGRIGDSAEEIQNGWRPDAVKALHSRLIVETLMGDLKLEASDEELAQEIERLAEGEEDAAEEIKKYYEQDNMKEYLREDIKERKLFDMLLAENTIKPGKKENYLDLVSNNG